MHLIISLYECMFLFIRGTFPIGYTCVSTRTLSPNARIVHFLTSGVSPVDIFNCSRAVSIPTGFTAPSRATGNGLPGKRPHGNRIRAWGLSASRSAPILHRISSLDGVRATGEHTSPHRGLRVQQNKPGKLSGGPFLHGAPKEEKCGNKASFALGFFFFKANSFVFF